MLLRKNWKMIDIYGNWKRSNGSIAMDRLTNQLN